MAGLAAQFHAFSKRWDDRELMETERRKLDDERDRKHTQKMDEVLDRLDKHGTRTTALETKWEAFFGDQGAFKLVVKGLDKLDGKTDKLAWLLAIGIGIMVAVQYFHPGIH